MTTTVKNIAELKMAIRHAEERGEITDETPLRTIQPELPGRREAHLVEPDVGVLKPVDSHIDLGCPTEPFFLIRW